jgi:hypothetical protein
MVSDPQRLIKIHAFRADRIYMEKPIEIWAFFLITAAKIFNPGIIGVYL